VEPSAEGEDRSSMMTIFGDIQRNLDNVYAMLQVLFNRYINKPKQSSEMQRMSGDDHLINLHGPVPPAVLVDTFQSA
jgi:hypothetical protein